MKKILLVLAMIAASVFLAQPAVAADTDAPADPGVETTTEAAEPEPAPEAAAEPVAPAPEEQAPDTSTPPPADTGETPPTVNEEEPPPVDDANKTDDAPDESTSGNAPNVEAVEAAPVKIPICHSTSSQSNPYVQNSPNASGDLHGHTGHTGGIFPAPGWGDIIPPFVFGNVNFPGMNWTTAGQAIYNNNCNVPNEVPIPLIDATAVPPTATPPTCLADGALVLPTTEGVIYESTPAGTGPGNYTVTASAAVGYVLTNPLYEEPIQVLAQLTGPQCQVNGLLPATPGVTTSAATCSANGGLVFNDDPKIIYIVVPFFGNSVLVVALPAPGYYLTQFPFIKVVPIPQKLTGSQCDSVDLTICHRTNSNVNPYNEIGPATAGVANGHDTQHEGPIWNPTLKGQGIEWGDIIPPYHYNNVDYPGQNWTAEGQAILANGCVPAEGLSQEVIPEITTSDVCDGGVRPTPVAKPGLSYEYTDGDGINGPWEITATALEGFEIPGDAQFVFTGDAGDEASCLTPAVDVTETCDGAESPTPVDIEGLAYEFTVGDGKSGAWEITATPLEGFFLADDAQTVFTGNAGDPDSCIKPEDDDKDENELLPDTGGLPLWILLIAGPMTAAGLIILMRREPVSRTSTGGGMPSYSLILPPAPKPLGIKRAHAATEHIGFMKAVGNVVAAIGAFFRGGRR